MESNSEKFSSVNSTGLLNTHEDYSDQKHEATQKTRSGNTVMLEKFAKDVIENEDPIIDFQIDFLRQAAENEDNDVSPDLKATDFDDDVSYLTDDVMLECSSASLSEEEIMSPIGFDSNEEATFVFDDFSNNNQCLMAADNISESEADFYKPFLKNNYDSFQDASDTRITTGETSSSFSPFSDQSYSDFLSFFQNEVLNPTMNCWRPAPTSHTSQQYFRYGNETWVASDTNISSSKNQPTQTLLIPVLSGINSGSWLSSERSENEKSDIYPFLSDSSHIPHFETNSIEKGIDSACTASTAEKNHPPTGDEASVNKFLEKDKDSRSMENRPRSENNAESCYRPRLEIQDAESCFSFEPCSSSWPKQTQIREISTSSENSLLEANVFCQNNLAAAHLETNDLLSHMYGNSFPVDAFFRCHGRSFARNGIMTYEDHVSSLPNHVSPNDVFCMVPGRLGTPYYGKKHLVTVGEILRRILTPESLNISLLGPILRKAKSKNGSLYLRQKLHQIGVDLPQGRRKTAQCTLFTSLTESEAGQFAEDYRKICECKFPARKMALEASSRWKASAPATDDLTAIPFKNILFLIDVCIELCAQSSNIPGPRNELEKKLYEFDALTHTFGLKCLNSSLNCFRALVVSLSEMTS